MEQLITALGPRFWSLTRRDENQFSAVGGLDANAPGEITFAKSPERALSELLALLEQKAPK